MAKYLKDIYKEQYLPNVRKPVPFKTFKQIWVEFTDAIMDELLLEGKHFNMRSNLSDLRVIRTQRNPKHLTVDHNSTRQLRKEDPTFTGVVYFTDDWWCRILWKKSRAKLKNKSKWSFRPTRGEKGMKKKLARFLQSDEFAYLKFRQNGNV